MKFYPIIAMLAASAALVGCKPENQNLTEKPVTGQEVKDQYKDALKTTKDYATQSKDEFVATMDEKIKDLDAKIKSLSDKSADYKDDAKTRADKALADLHEQRAALGKKYDELKQASKDAWDKTREGFVSAWDSLTTAYENTKAKFQ
jgi:hypothetical protein